MEVMAIIGIALPLLKQAVLAYMEITGKTTLTKADLEAQSPDDILADMGIKVPK